MYVNKIKINYMEKFTITPEEKEILQLNLQSEEEQEEMFEVFYPESSTFDDIGEYYRVKYAFSKGMMMQLYLHQTNKIKEITKDETVLLLQQEVKKLQEKLIEEKRLSKETIAKLKLDNDLKMSRLKKNQDQYYTDLKENMAKKLKLNGLWMVGAFIAALIAMAEFVYIVIKL